MDASLSIEQLLQATLNDPVCSRFLKGIIRTGLERDAVDVANELEWVSALFSQRADAILKEAKHAEP